MLEPIEPLVVFPETCSWVVASVVTWNLKVALGPPDLRGASHTQSTMAFRRSGRGNCLMRDMGFQRTETAQLVRQGTSQ